MKYLTDSQLDRNLKGNRNFEEYDQPLIRALNSAAVEKQ